jgi:hypothetical protein
VDVPPHVAALVVAGALAGCGEGEGQRAEGEDKRASSGPKLGEPTTVPARANIFGAGHTEPPAPGGGGAGVLPPVWHLPEGSGRVVTVPAATGRVNPIVGTADENGAGGDGVGPTEVVSWHGISGIVHRRNGMFLVGVFLGDARPGARAPESLDFTKNERFTSLAPRVGQTFFIGDGRNRAFHVPPRATRLYLGFADGYRYLGPPGWYDNNTGKLRVEVRMTSR